MRIHSDVLTINDVYAAARAARVSFGRNTEHKSRSRARAFDVTLTGESRRRPNDRQSAGDVYAATWDQWGVFLAHLFAVDPNMGTPYYSDAENFADKTADRFGAPETIMTDDGYRDIFAAYGEPADAHCDHVFRFSGTACQQECTKCSAIQRWMV